MLPEGHYWARHTDGTVFVVLFQDGLWFCCGVGHPIDFDTRQIIKRLESPHH